MRCPGYPSSDALRLDFVQGSMLALDLEELFCVVALSADSESRLSLDT